MRISDWSSDVCSSDLLSPRVDGVFVRANIWPAEADHCFKASGAKTFVYGVPHDHNFSFLTSGYFGPGYRSDYYEYDYAQVAGYVGERPGLRFIERSALSEGKQIGRASCRERVCQYV